MPKKAGKKILKKYAKKKIAKKLASGSSGSSMKGMDAYLALFWLSDQRQKGKPLDSLLPLVLLSGSKLNDHMLPLIILELQRNGGLNDPNSQILPYLLLASQDSSKQNKEQLVMYLLMAQKGGLGNNLLLGSALGLVDPMYALMSAFQTQGATPAQAQQAVQAVAQVAPAQAAQINQVAQANPQQAVQMAAQVINNNPGALVPNAPPRPLAMQELAQQRVMQQGRNNIAATTYQNWQNQVRDERRNGRAAGAGPFGTFGDIGTQGAAAYYAQRKRPGQLPTVFDPFRSIRY